jgi:hypothetical protein
MWAAQGLKQGGYIAKMFDDVMNDELVRRYL